MAQRLPVPGGDEETWGTILNDFLLVEHNTDGTLKAKTDGTLAPLTNGKVSPSLLGSGAASASNYLRGDGAWAAPPVTSVAGKTGDVTLVQGDIADLSADLAATEKTANKGIASGYAPLDTATKVPFTYLPVGTGANTVAAGDDPRLGIATTKRATMTFGSPNSGLSNGTPLATGATSITARVLNMMVRRPTRYRFRISNASAQNSTNPGTPVQLDSLWIGPPAYTDAAHNNKWLGDFASTPTQVFNGPAALPVSGTDDVVTPWITNAGEIAERSPFVLSMGITVSGGGAGITMTDSYGGMQYGATSSDQAGVVAPAGGYNYAGFPLDVRLEYEALAPKSELVAFVIGASGESSYPGPGDSSSTPRALNDPVDAWPSVWASRQGYHVINGGLFGSATTDWLSASTRPYTRFDLSTTVPDIAIIGTMPSNDIALGTSTAAIIANYYTIVATLRSLGIKRIFGTTIPPRNLSGGTETTRNEFNAFLRAIPSGLEDVFDLDFILRDPANRSVIQAGLVAPDNIHPLRSAYRVIASTVSIGTTR